MWKIVAIYAFAFFSFSIVAHSCPGAQTECKAGGTGSGGCYDSGRASCEDGLICAAPMSVCRKGSKGAGGCYTVGKNTCNGGRIATNPLGRNVAVAHLPQRPRASYRHSVTQRTISSSRNRVACTDTGDGFHSCTQHSDCCSGCCTTVGSDKRLFCSRKANCGG